MISKEDIKTLLKKIQKDTSHSIFTDEEIENFLKDKEKKYPRFKLSLSCDEIENMKAEGILNGENKISPKIFDGKKELTPLEKLLLGVIWKNGDYGKEKCIIDNISFFKCMLKEDIIAGAVSKEERKGLNAQESSAPKDIPTPFVFWNFGRYIADKTMPIVDQHTARAYRKIIYDKIEENDKKDAYANNNETEYENYLKWFEQIINGGDFKELPKEDAAYYFDSILFEYGKKLKKDIKKKSKMSCKKCGKDIPKSSKFCRECGSPIVAADSIEKSST